ncbi:putative ubiquitin carboxyl-terminal hydrolase 12 [Cytospora mali]|uniref:ubiquitinyl hydrolase 1 n=1 Tax=Cytospora mali TaxID=578113 RepID=A0A194UX74_CYTMA|nr:putative ubiquitin carboxyl-terminal hydrolase 12 [Valsa mali var. pyri (nom. inval.)]
MSRPDELPRSASPLKRRAPSLPSDENTDALEDVDMISTPATNHGTPVGDADLVRDAEQSAQEVDTNKLDDEPLAPVAMEDNDTVIPDFLDSLEVDRASVEETQVGSEPEDNALDDVPNGNDAQNYGQEQGKAKDQNSAEGKSQSQNGSSSTNSEDAAESDAKTIDTVATSASAEASNKPSSPTGVVLESALGAKTKGTRSSRNSPGPSSIWTRGRSSRGDRVLGQTGLTNLGNTCYMNSALQCIRSVEELTKYFLADEHLEEVNRNNPLGHDGQVALAYGYLLKQIYKDPPPSSTTPRSFKDTVGRYAPQFSGWGQQDTQEFLGFLLDGLQEDLNRVKKKPYIEKPDSTDEMVNDPAAIRGLAAQVWDIHKKRDDSIISDLFTGLYKSTLVCPECDKVSITFDPFTNLTLPLPIQNIWCRKIKYFPLNDVPVTINVELDKTATIRKLKDFISARVGVPSERIIGAEEYKDKFFKIYEDAEQACGEITKDDIPAFFELEDQPTNIKRPGKRKVKALYSYNDKEEVPDWDDPMAEKLVVPVLHRLNPRSSKESRVHSSRTSENVSPPHFIILNPKEAQDEDMIRRKVLEKVATFTTWPALSCLHNAESENPDQDQSPVNSSEVDLSADGMVIASSVEGEEDMVDVTMQDTADASSQQEPDRPSTLLKKFNSRRPDFINPAVYLDGRLQNLFDLSFFKEDALIPTGWQAISSADRLFPRLDTRKPRPPTPSDDDMPSPSGSGTATEESSAEEVDDTPDTGAQTRMVDEVSEEDSDTSLPDLKACLNPTWSFPTSELEPNTLQDVNKPPNLPLRPQDTKLRGGKNGGRKKIKAHKTYSKKAQKRFNKQQQQREAGRRSNKLNSIMDEDPEWGSKVDGGPLVRLGEGIIVDWDPAAWDTVFGQDTRSDADSTQGRPTFLNLATLKDPQLEAKSQARRLRHNKGISLDDCLNEFEKDEILSEEDKWYCPRCKEHRRAAKKFDIWKTPDILIVHLKRFSSSGTRRDKIDAVVDFPIEGLDISHRVLEKEDGKQEIYDLIAIDDHMGGLGGGHYTAFAKNFVDGQWYKFDDSFAGRFSKPQAMITSHAYLLFYRRRSDRALGGPKFDEILRRFEPMEEDEDDDSAINSQGSESR